MDTIDQPSGRHPINIGHLVMGLAFLGIVGIWALVQTDIVDRRRHPLAAADPVGLRRRRRPGRDRDHRLPPVRRQADRLGR